MLFTVYSSHRTKYLNTALKSQSYMKLNLQDEVNINQFYVLHIHLHIYIYIISMHTSFYVVIHIHRSLSGLFTFSLCPAIYQHLYTEQAVQSSAPAFPLKLRTVCSHHHPYLLGYIGQLQMDQHCSRFCYMQNIYHNLS